jgi:DNA repair exonuclease SbcCD ATPase subunit
MASISGLSKKTKGEILAEYEKLLASVDNARGLAQAVFQQETLDIMAKARDAGLPEAGQVLARAKGDIAQTLSDLSGKLGETLAALGEKIQNESKKFEELQNAIEASKNLLEHQYNLQISAQALEILLADYKAKKEQAESEFKKIVGDLENEVFAKKTVWSREQETFDYEAKLKKDRLKKELEEIGAEKNKAWQERENVLRQKESEVSALKEKVEKMPVVIEKEIAQREKEISARVENEFKIKTGQSAQEWQAKDAIYKIKIENLEAQAKKQEAEIVLLKKEQETASRKAQDLAIKIVESTGNSKTETKPDPVAAQ